MISQLCLDRLVSPLVIGVAVLGVLSASVYGQPPAGRQAERNNARTAASAVSIFDRGGCGNCHIIPGISGADGTVGPDLSTLGKVAGSRKPNTTAKEYVRESILNPDAFIAPGEFESGIMPQQFGNTLSKEDVDNLVDFLVSLGVSPANTERRVKVKLDASRPPETRVTPFATPPGQTPSDAQIALGRYFFFDRRLSASNALSCASCHRPDKAFTDGEPVSRGYPGTELFRNTPTLLNVVFAKTAYWDGRLTGDDLPTIVRDHLTEPFFMAADGRLLVERVKQVPAYVELFQEAFKSEPNFGGILKAISAYVGSLYSPATAYDRFASGDRKALASDAQAGWALFRGRAKCATCHPAPLFTDYRYYDLGLTTPPALLDKPERYITFRRFFRGLGVPNFQNLRSDVGRMAVTMADDDRNMFRTPSLREVSRTGPYMHDGRINSLEGVVKFYNGGGGNGQRAGLSQLGLTPVEEQQLVSFLKSLASAPSKVATPELPDYEMLPLGRPAKSATTSGRGTKDVIATTPRAVTPLPGVPVPPDNPTTADKAALGRLLFFDVRLSAEAGVSCNTCHPANTGYTARTAISVGGTGTSHWRNASTLYNVGHFQKLNWDGARTSIEGQNDGAWSGAVAGNLDPDMAEERLAQVPEYRGRFKKVFGEELPTWANALRAVAAYQRTLNSEKVPFDSYLMGDHNAIGESSKRGYKLFLGKANCIACHDGPLLSDDDYHALGVPTSPDFLNSPIKQITFRYEQFSLGVPRPIYAQAQEDMGLYYVTKRAEDVGKFRTPSLRELKHTAPYMHNGLLKGLDAVVAFYNQGGGVHVNKSPLLRPLSLTRDEQRDLVAFLESLSGDPLADKPPQLPPYGRYIPPQER